MRIKALLLQFSRVLALFVLSMGIAFLSPNFLKTSNLMNVVRQASPQIIMAIGMTVVFLTGGIDLSMGSVTTLVSIVTAFAMVRMNVNWVLAIVAALLVGALSGLANGLLIAKVKLPPPVATYGMLWIGRGLAFAIMGATPIFGFPEAFRYIGVGYLAGVPMPIWIMLAIAVLVGLFLNFTTLGRSVYAVGGNAAAARASGIPADRVLIYVYIISGLMAAVTGVILCARLGAVDQNLGAPFLLPAIASPVMGGTSMTGGQGGVAGAILGSLIMVVVTNGMNLLRISSLWQQFVVGLVVVLAVWLDGVVKQKQT
jgi:ribose transport system permease protein